MMIYLCAKILYKMQMELLDELYPSRLKTLSMTDLYDTTFEIQPSLIEDFLHRGTYLFVGSPKVGKSFLMLQIAYHISTGTPLWAHTVRKATVLYLALEDDYKRLQKRLFQMFGENESENLYLATQCKTIGSGLDEQIKGFKKTSIITICITRNSPLFRRTSKLFKSYGIL